METANTTIDYKNLESSFEMQVNKTNIRNKRKSKGKYGSKHRLPFTPKKVLKNDVPKIKEQLQQEQKLLTLRIDSIEKQNSLLTGDIDIDYLETLYRQKFMVGKSNERIYAE